MKAAATDRRSDEMEPPPPIGYRTQSPDTTYDVERRLVRAWRGMPVCEKARRLRDCCGMVEQLSLAGVRLRHCPLQYFVAIGHADCARTHEGSKRRLKPT